MKSLCSRLALGDCQSFCSARPSPSRGPRPTPRWSTAAALLLDCRHAVCTHPIQPCPSQQRSPPNSPPRFFHSPHCRPAWDSPHPPRPPGFQIPHPIGPHPPQTPGPQPQASQLPSAPQAPRPSGSPCPPAPGWHSSRTCTRSLGCQCLTTSHLHGPAGPSTSQQPKLPDVRPHVWEEPRGAPICSLHQGESCQLCPDSSSLL